MLLAGVVLVLVICLALLLAAATDSWPWAKKPGARVPQGVSAVWGGTPGGASKKTWGGPRRKPRAATLGGAPGDPLGAAELAAVKALVARGRANDFGHALQGKAATLLDATIDAEASARAPNSITAKPERVRLIRDMIASLPAGLGRTAEQTALKVALPEFVVAIPAVLAGTPLVAPPALTLVAAGPAPPAAPPLAPPLIVPATIAATDSVAALTDLNNYDTQLLAFQAAAQVANDSCTNHLKALTTDLTSYHDWNLNADVQKFKTRVEAASVADVPLSNQFNADLGILTTVETEVQAWQRQVDDLLRDSKQARNACDSFNTQIAAVSIKATDLVSLVNQPIVDAQASADANRATYVAAANAATAASDEELRLNTELTAAKQRVADATTNKLTAESTAASAQTALNAAKATLNGYKRTSGIMDRPGLATTTPEAIDYRRYDDIVITAKSARKQAKKAVAKPATEVTESAQAQTDATDAVNAASAVTTAANAKAATDLAFSSASDAALVQAQADHGFHVTTANDIKARIDAAAATVAAFDATLVTNLAAAQNQHDHLKPLSANLILAVGAERAIIGGVKLTEVELLKVDSERAQLDATNQQTAAVEAQQLAADAVTASTTANTSAGTKARTIRDHLTNVNTALAASPVNWAAQVAELESAIALIGELTSIELLAVDTQLAAADAQLTIARKCETDSAAAVALITENLAQLRDANLDADQNADIDPVAAYLTTATNNSTAIPPIVTNIDIHAVGQINDQRATINALIAVLPGEYETRRAALVVAATAKIDNLAVEAETALTEVQRLGPLNKTSWDLTTVALTEAIDAETEADKQLTIAGDAANKTNLSKRNAALKLVEPQIALIRDKQVVISAAEIEIIDKNGLMGAQISIIDAKIVDSNQILTEITTICAAGTNELNDASTARDRSVTAKGAADPIYINCQAFETDPIIATSARLADVQATYTRVVDSRIREKESYEQTRLGIEAETEALAIGPPRHHYAIAESKAPDGPATFTESPPSSLLGSSPSSLLGSSPSSLLGSSPSSSPGRSLESSPGSSPGSSLESSLGSSLGSSHEISFFAGIPVSANAIVTVAPESLGILAERAEDPSAPHRAWALVLDPAHPGDIGALRHAAEAAAGLKLSGRTKRGVKGAYGWLYRLQSGGAHIVAYLKPEDCDIWSNN